MTDLHPNIPARYGDRRVTRMYTDMNKLRRLIRAEGTPAIQDQWDRVEEFVDFTFLGCPDCRATHKNDEGRSSMSSVIITLGNGVVFGIDGNQQFYIAQEHRGKELKWIELGHASEKRLDLLQLYMGHLRVHTDRS